MAMKTKTKKTGLHPQEIEVFYLLPSIRRELVLALKRKGIAQARIAEWLALTPAAISQYVSNKRGKEFTLSDALKKEVEQEAEHIDDNISAYSAIQSVVQKAVSTGFICKMHCALDPTIPKDCCLCKKGE